MITKKKGQTPSRGLAAKLIAQVLRSKQNLTVALGHHDFFRLEKSDRGFVQTLCYGVFRHYHALEKILEKLLKKPIKSKDSDIYSLLLIGIYQLWILQTKPHAAIYETAKAAQFLKKSWAVNFINGVLREFQRESENIFESLKNNETFKYSHPQWLIAQLKNAWPNHFEKILEANNQHPPLTLRVNQRIQTRDQYLEKLKSAGIEAFPTVFSKSGITLKEAINTNEIPGFENGECSIQDEAAQFSAELLDLKPNQIVLDACAAPGGKTTHILETEPHLKELMVVDYDPQRLEKIHENLERLSLHKKSKTQLTLTCLDAIQIDEHFPDKQFDRILCDAPCSATGVIRRHPDIKYLRQVVDIEKFATQQKALLNALWKKLKPGGLLLYITCSVLPQENTAVMADFLVKYPNATESLITAPWGIALTHGCQILPTPEGMDGFYYAILQK